MDARKDQWSDLFRTTIREQAALGKVYPNGSPTSISDVSVPIATFRPKTLEALDGLGKILEAEIKEFVQEQETYQGLLLTFNRMEFTTEGAVETELLVGRDEIEKLKKKIMVLGLEEVLPMRTEDIRSWAPCVRQRQH